MNENAIHRINPVEKMLKQGFEERPDSLIIGYTTADNLDVPPKETSVDLVTQSEGKRKVIPNEKCYAKIVKTITDDDRVVRAFFIKAASGGSLIDPWDSVNLNADRRYADHAGKIDKLFVKVSENCFKLYMRYLQTRNAAHFINAVREFNNG